MVICYNLRQDRKNTLLFYDGIIHSRDRMDDSKEKQEML